MRLADRGEEQVQVAGDVRHRADGRSRVAADGLLLDRDHRRQAEDEIDVGLRHLRDEALGVARERLHVAALPLGVDRVERQARLAGAREAGDDDQAVARDFHRDVLQVVHPRALHGDGRPHAAVLLRRRRRARAPTAYSPSGPSGRQKASSCSEAELRLVARTGADALAMSPWSARYSHAVVTPSMAKIAHEMALDLAGGADVAGLAQVGEHRRKQARRTGGHVLVHRRERRLDRLLRLLRVQQVGVDGLEERRD